MLNYFFLSFEEDMYVRHDELVQGGCTKKQKWNVFLKFCKSKMIISFHFTYLQIQILHKTQFYYTELGGPAMLKLFFLNFEEVM